MLPFQTTLPDVFVVVGACREGLTMSSQEEVRQVLAERLPTLAPGWESDVRRGDDGRSIGITLVHPASLGLGIVLDADADTEELASAVERWLANENRELAVVDAAPRITHVTLVKGLLAVAQSHTWGASEMRSVAFVLWESGCLTHDETAWLAGFVGPDASMAAISPLGP